MQTDDASRQGHLLVTNHHFLEKVVLNAFELVSLLSGRCAPEELRRHYPVLDQVAAEKPAQAPPR